MTQPRRKTTTAATVLRSVLHHGPVARSTIARLTGLSAAAVTRQYAELADLGLLREVAERRVPRVTVGRPHVPVDIDVARYAACGVHIAYAHTTVSLVDLRGHVLHQEREPHPARDAGAVLGRVLERVPASLAAHLGGRAPLGAGAGRAAVRRPARARQPGSPVRGQRGGRGDRHRRRRAPRAPRGRGQRGAPAACPPCCRPVWTSSPRKWCRCCGSGACSAPSTPGRPCASTTACRGPRTSSPAPSPRCDGGRCRLAGHGP